MSSKPTRIDLWAWPADSQRRNQPAFSTRIEFRVGFTGTREGMTGPQRAAVQGLLDQLRVRSSDRWLLFGLCVGSDDEAAADARERGYRLRGYPGRGPAEKRGKIVPEEERPPKPYLERDLDIVADCHVLVAAPRRMREELRSGTWSTVRRARSAGRPHWIVYPDGSIEHVPNPDPS